MPFKEIDISKIIEEKCKNDPEFKIAFNEVNNMKLCSKDCHPICDFCKHLNRKSGDDGESWCEVWREIVNWCDYCDEFWCFRYNDVKEE